MTPEVRGEVDTRLYSEFMEHRPLGRSGLRVSELSLGTWVNHGDRVTQQDADAVIGAALDAGITTFDTADSYAAGRAESVLGLALKGQRREGLELSTKVFWPMGPGANEQGLSRKHILESCHASLRRLQTDYIDIYQAHRFDPGTPLVETLRAFDDLVRQGKVLYVGVSEWSADQIGEAVQLSAELGFTRLASNQPQYSLLWRVIESEIVPVCQAAGLGQIVWSPLAQGVLTGKYSSGSAVPAGSRAADVEASAYISRWMRPEVLAAVERLGTLAAELGASIAQLSLAWVLSRPGVSSAIIGASRPEQIVENTKAVDLCLDADTCVAIDAALGDVIQWARS